jgi:hypothetical protein
MTKIYNGVPESQKPKKPIEWKESLVSVDKFLDCYAWCEKKFGDEYECWNIGGNRWGSNRGLWKTYSKRGSGGELTVFCFRDEKARLECELKFG